MFWIVDRAVGEVAGTERSAKPGLQTTDAQKVAVKFIGGRRRRFIHLPHAEKVGVNVYGGRWRHSSRVPGFVCHHVEFQLLLIIDAERVDAAVSAGKVVYFSACHTASLCCADAGPQMIS
jgi:hypothetical protein